MLTRRHLLAAGSLLATTGFTRLSAAQPQRVLCVLHQNDLHSHHDPDSRGVGGTARLATLFRQQRALAATQGRTTITIDAGDQFVGSLFYTHWRGAAELAVMNAVGFDAMALGNHEFDHGPATLGRFVRAAPFPILAANLDVSNEPELAGHVHPSTVIEREGLRIGIVGITLPETPATSSPGPNLRFNPALPALQAEVDRLRASGIATVIALTHVGLPADRALVAASRGLDLVVGGHSHTLLANGLSGAEAPTPQVVADADGRLVPIVQIGAYGRCIGRVDLALDAVGRAAAFKADALEGARDIAPDAAVEAELTRLAAPIAAMRAEVLGQAAAPFPITGCRLAECGLGNLVADALLAAARPQGAVAAITNAGGLRTALKQGQVTRADVTAVLPFGNTMSVVTLSGAALRGVLEHALSREPEAEGSGRFPQVAGLAVRFDPARPVGARILRLALRGADGSERVVEDGSDYRIATNNFLRGGGDGYALLRAEARDGYEASEPLDEIVADAIEAARTVAPRLDGRLLRGE